jgi:hypothetical protein
MGAISLELDFEDFKEAARQLSEDQREELLYELNPSLGRAFENMGKEVLEEEVQGDTVYFDEG